MLTFDNPPPYRYKIARFDTKSVLLGNHQKDYISQLEVSRVQRLYQFICALHSFSMRKREDVLFEEMKFAQSLDETKLKALQDIHNTQIEQIRLKQDEYIATHISNSEKLYKINL